MGTSAEKSLIIGEFEIPFTRPLDFVIVRGTDPCTGFTVPIQWIQLWFA
jgi:hypothetical protein